MRSLIISLLITFPAITPHAFAQEYSWSSQFDWYRGYGSSPREACSNAISKYISAGNRSDILLLDVQYSSPKHFICYWCHPKGTCYIGQPGYGFSAVRSGDTCSRTYNETTGECALDSQKGPPEENACQGNPINIAIGNKFQTESDYAGSVGLNFNRSYNSLDGRWRHTFSTYLRFAGTQYVSVVMHHGRESFFTISGTAVTPTSADLGVLSKTAAGWQYVSTDNERFTFNSAGKLAQWSNAHGAVHQLVYSGNQVTVTDNLGKSLSFTEDADHQPLTLTAPGHERASVRR